MRNRVFTLVNGFRGLVAILLVAILASGCARWNFPPPDKRPRGPFYFEAGYDEVWSAAIAVVTELEFRIIFMNKVEGFFTTDEKQEACYAKCLYTSGDTLIVMFDRFNGFVSVTPVESTTSYRYSYNKSNAAPIAVTSTKLGRLTGYNEKNVGEMIAKKLGRPFLLSLPEQGK